jgi:uncharacterized alkaline shock family protein YloU
MSSLIPDPLNPSTTLPPTAGAVTDAASDRVGEGTTTIRDSVIAKVAGLAAREVAGVHTLGTVQTRALGAILDAISSADAGQGVGVSIDGDDVTVQIVLVADYPVPLYPLADQVRASVILAIEGLVGLHVAAVNVTITDIYVAGKADDNDVA